MSCTGTSICDCGCCAGTSVLTPQPRNNPPGLSSLSYRAGTWASFKESMLARLSSSDYPALAALKTRDDDDFTIAFLDAAAIVLDILTFYQERLANENYLRTAGQLRSLTELSRLIGYQPSPGVSASTYLAFSLKAAPGQAPDPSTPAITIPKGTQIQSVPAQGQTPQVFETSADIQAKADWSALPVQTGQPWTPPEAANSAFGNGIYLRGISTQLQPGDSLLLLGVDREQWVDPGQPAQGADPREQWDVVVLNNVQVDTIRKLTYVSWDRRLPHVFVVANPNNVQAPSTPWSTAKVFAFRQKASLFGHNAPSPYLFVNAAGTNTSLPGLINVPVPPSLGAWTWNNFQLASAGQIDLDATYPKIVVNGWFALINNVAAQSYVQLFKVQGAQAKSLSNFALSGKVSQLAGDFDYFNFTGSFPLQSTEVWAQSDQLDIAEQPLTFPLYGTLLDLHDLRPDLIGVQVVALSGMRQKISVNNGVEGLYFVPDAPTASQAPLNPGDVLFLTGPPPLPFTAAGAIPDWSLSANWISIKAEDANGRTGTVQASLNLFSLVPSSKSDPAVSEYALVSSVVSVEQPYPHTQIQLQSALSYCYDRNATTVNVNAGLATQGQSVSEIMGSGNASTPNQNFTLKQSPLTYIQAPTPTGRQTTLQVEANGVAWTEVPSLYGEDPSLQVFGTLNQSDGTTDVLFGDGVEGALLPTGQNNILANYRIGLGSAGNVGANTLTTLMDRPLGVSGVTNPGAATGGQDAQSVGDIRSNAPLTVLTLGRAVSLTDYESYATTFAGIAKAYALWIPSGPGQGVFLTVAAASGSPLPPGDPTLTNLVTSLHDYGNPLIPIRVQSFLETLFGLSADIQYDPAYDQATVQAQVLQTLTQVYSFAQRTFGQGVSVDEIATVIQAVPGVMAVNVKELHTVATSAGGDLSSSAAPAIANEVHTVARKAASFLRYKATIEKFNQNRALATGRTGSLSRKVAPATSNETQIGFGREAGLLNRPRTASLSLSHVTNWRSRILPAELPRPHPESVTRIYPYLPVANPKSLPQPAEILVLDLDPGSVVLGVMS
jgi:hypothetical protein